MLNTFANVLDHASKIIVVLPGSTEKLSASFQEMLNQMTLAFGKSWMDYIVINVSFWSYDEIWSTHRLHICNEYPECLGLVPRIRLIS